MIVLIRVLSLIAVCALPLIAGDAGAQAQRSGGESQKIMQQYQQLASERTALQAENAGLKKDLAAAKAQLDAIKKERDALKARISGAESAVTQVKGSQEVLQQNLEQSKQRMSELVARFREVGQNLKDVETERNKVRADLSERSRAFDVCAENNQQLYEINRDLLNRYEHVGLLSKVSASEPFTRLTRTRIENLVDETRDRAAQLRVNKSTPPAQ
jgi:chromosome segregation ATPase